MALKNIVCIISICKLNEKKKGFVQWKYLFTNIIDCVNDDDDVMVRFSETKCYRMT